MVQHKYTTKSYDMRWDASVQDLKNRVAEKEALSVGLVELEYKGACLRDYCTLIEAGLFDNDHTPQLKLLKR